MVFKQKSSLSSPPSIWQRLSSRQSFLISFGIIITIATIAFTYNSLFLKIPQDDGDFKVNATAVYRIPKVCYQTWMTKNLDQISNSTKNVMQMNKKNNPDIEFQLWDDNDVDHFMATEFSGDVYNAFKSIHPAFGAAKADIFRYCILYKRGGLYLDIKSMFKVTYVFGRIIQPDDECILDIRKQLERTRVKWGYSTFEQWCLAFAPGHPYLKNMIDRIVSSVKRRVQTPSDPAEYPGFAAKYRVMRITGPDALAVAIHDAVVEHGVRHREVDYRKWLQYSVVKGNPEYKFVNKTHYGALESLSLYSDSKGRW